MADKSIASGEREHHLSLSSEVEGLQEIPNTSQASANVLVISDDDDDDDEIEIVQLKPKSVQAEILLEDHAADEKPIKCSEVVTEDEKEEKEEKEEKDNSDSLPGSKSPRDQTCSVCLGKFDNKAFLDQCFRILLNILIN